MTKSFFAALRMQHDPSGDEIARAWLAARQRGPIPARTHAQTGQQLKDIFSSYVHIADATLSMVNAKADVPAHIAAMLPKDAMPTAIDAMSDPFLMAMDWRGAGLDPQFGTARAEASVGIVRPFRAVAETGSLVMVSGPASPNLINFLPDRVIAVVPLSRLCPTMEDVWADLRHDYGRTLPRSIVFVTGPSRSADIEQTLQIGAHGPRQLHIVMVGDATA